jgi:DNA-binding transcriptional LysR family regulator
MDIRHIKYFESIVRNKKITKAAEELHISQPSLSSQIKALEQELGCKLIERNAREIRLTEPGIILYRHAAHILQEFENIQREMKDVKDTGLGEITIGIFPTSVYWLPQIILRFKQRFPDVLIKIKEMGAEQIEDSIKNYDIHIGISSIPIQTDLMLFNPIFEEQLFLITSLEHPFRDLEIINISDIEHEPFILYQTGYQLRQHVLDSCEQAGFYPNVVFESGRLETICSLVMENLGVALAPESYIKFSAQKRLKVIKVRNPTPTRTICITTHQNRYLLPAVDELKSLITNFFSETPV